MEIVPGGTDLTVEARIQPSDIDQLSAGQDAVLHLTAFNRNTTPELSFLVSPEQARFDIVFRAQCYLRPSEAPFGA